MATSTGSAVRSARPTINLDNRDRPELSDGLLGLTIVENTAGLYRCEAMFGNWGTTTGGGRIGWVYFDRQVLDFGKPLKVLHGDNLLFEGRIMALEGLFPESGPRSITALAEDRFQDLRMTRRTRAFVDVTDADVVRRIAGDHGLTADVDLPTVQHKLVAQVNQSDLAFLRERARGIDAELWMEGTTLHAVRHSARGGQPSELVYRQQLREFAALADLAEQRTSVTVAGWDVASKQGITHEATSSTISGELNGDVSGVSILQQALGARKEQLSHTVPLTTAQAQSEAESFFRIGARRFVTVRGLAEVQPTLHAGSYLRVAEVGPLFSGRYYVTEVRHVFDRTGIRTEFTAERAGIGRA
jgi:phage protein D